MIFVVTLLILISVFFARNTQIEEKYRVGYFICLAIGTVVYLTFSVLF